MNEVTRIVDGEITTQKQTEVTVGDGQIVTYLLSEHQFETLGKNDNYNNYLGICTFCFGITIPEIIDLFSVNWDEPITIGLLIKCCICTLCFGIGILTAAICYKKKSNLQTTYHRLKQEARTITERQRQP